MIGLSRVLNCLFGGDLNGDVGMCCYWNFLGGGGVFLFWWVCLGVVGYWMGWDGMRMRMGIVFVFELEL